jgi:ribosomal protein S18 acetylase RimI-like enzyme
MWWERVHLSAIAIQRLTSESVQPAAQLLAGSMRDNPLHRRVFGDDEAQLARLLATAFARLLQRQLRSGLVLGAFDGATLVGVAAMVPPGHCQSPLQEKLSMLAILAREGLLRRLPDIHQWLRIWARQDPASDHWHLGPAAVDRGRQGQGIGTALMRAICDELDQRQAVGYLETDKRRNVVLYRRGGFAVVVERPVLGVTNWFMLRQPPHA